MAERRLARIVQAGGVQTVNWTTRATETYNANSPGADPSTWGTAAEIANLDRVFTATGNEKTHYGALLTFVNTPDRLFFGAQVKIRPTYTDAVTPKIELWTLLGTTWTLRRRVELPPIVRSGDSLALDLTFDGISVPDAVWITMTVIGGDTSLAWICLHLYGDCTRDPVTSPCPPGTDPTVCEPTECSADFETFLCDPLPLPPDLPLPDPITFPPILVDVPMPTSYEETDGVVTHPCPGPTGIRMYFGELPTGGSVQVTLVNSEGLVFAEGTTQTISSPGTMDWTVSSGYGKSDPDIGSGSAAGYLFPRFVVDHITFAFTRLKASPITLLDILLYFWTYDWFYEEVCYVDGPPIDPLPPATDPPDDAQQTTYQRVFEQWLVYADTAANATASRAAHAARVAGYAQRDLYLDYGLSRDVLVPGIPSDAELLRNALAATRSYLNEATYPVKGPQNTAELTLPFVNLADGHLITLRVFLVPVNALLNPAFAVHGGLIPAYQLNPFRAGAKVLPYNPTPDVQDVNCNDPPTPPDPTTGDFHQRVRMFRNFTLTPQITKWGGIVVQTGGYHLARSVTEDASFDVLGVHPQPVPPNPLAFTGTLPGSPVTCISGCCYQWFTGGFAYLITVRVYEPVATPIGATVSLAATPEKLVRRMLLGGPIELDATWP